MARKIKPQKIEIDKPYEQWQDPEVLARMRAQAEALGSLRTEEMQVHEQQQVRIGSVLRGPGEELRRQYGEGRDLAAAFNSFFWLRDPRYEKLSFVQYVHRSSKVEHCEEISRNTICRRLHLAHGYTPEEIEYYAARGVCAGALTTIAMGPEPLRPKALEIVVEGATIHDLEEILKAGFLAYVGAPPEGPLDQAQTAMDECRNKIKEHKSKHTRPDPRCPYCGGEQRKTRRGQGREAQAAETGADPAALRLREQQAGELEAQLSKTQKDLQDKTEQMAAWERQLSAQAEAQKQEEAASRARLKTLEEEVARRALTPAQQEQERLNALRAQVQQEQERLWGLLAEVRAAEEQKEALVAEQERLRRAMEEEKAALVAMQKQQEQQKTVLAQKQKELDEREQSLDAHELRIGEQLLQVKAKLMAQGQEIEERLADVIEREQVELGHYKELTLKARAQCEELTRKALAMDKTGRSPLDETYRPIDVHSTLRLMGELGERIQDLAGILREQINGDGYEYQDTRQFPSVEGVVLTFILITAVKFGAIDAVAEAAELLCKLKEAYPEEYKRQEIEYIRVQEEMTQDREEAELDEDEEDDDDDDDED